MFRLNSNRKNKFIAILAVVILVISSLLILSITIATKPTTSGTMDTEFVRGNDYTAYGDYSEYNGMETISFNTKVAVMENNVYHVEETIVVNYTGMNKHGLYRNIPYEGTIYRSDADGNKTETVEKAKITNIKVPGYKYSVSVEDNGREKQRVIQIGDGDITVRGRYEYVITYDFTRPNDTFDGYDEFYFNLFPVNWETAIPSASFSVTFPKPADLSQAKLFVGGGVGEVANLTITDTTISLSNITTLGYRNGMSMYLELPNKYFLFNYTFIVLLIVFGLLGVAMLAIALLLKSTKFRQDKVVPVVTFDPPKGMTSAEIGYIVDGLVDNKDVLSLIIYWASKGYITIVEQSSTETIFIKMRNLPESAEHYEKIMFDSIFESGDKVALSDLQYKFAPTLKLTKSTLAKSYKTPEKRLFTKLSDSYHYIMTAISAIIMGALYSSIVVINNSFSLIYIVISIVLGVITIAPMYSLMYGIKISPHNKKVGSSCLASGIVGLIIVNLILLFFMSYVYNLHYEFLATVVLEVLLLAMTGLVCYSQVMTQSCYDKRSEIYGLKDFIDKVEKDKLEKMVAEDPKYFYNILPYAYVLDVTDEWSKKFEGLALEAPTWYVGNGMDTFSTVIFISMLNRQMRLCNTVMSAPKPSTNGGSGGFSGGGGFGGGFSGGGGFGGGGGGSW